MSSTQLTTLRSDSEDHILTIAQSSDAIAAIVSYDTEGMQESKVQSSITHRVPVIAQIAAEEGTKFLSGIFVLGDNKTFLLQGKILRHYLVNKR